MAGFVLYVRLVVHESFNIKGEQRGADKLNMKPAKNIRTPVEFTTPDNFPTHVLLSTGTGTVNSRRNPEFRVYARRS